MKKIIDKWQSLSLMLRIVLGLILGAVLGLECPQLKGLSIFGELFVNGLKAIAPVLVAILVTASIAKAKSGLGPRFRTVIMLYVLSTILAALVAVTASHFYQVTLVLRDAQSGSSLSGLTEFLSNLAKNLVDNPVHAVTSANYLGVLFWAIVMGLALKIKASERTVQLVSDLSVVVSQVVKWIIQFAPFGIMGLVFQSVSTSGIDIFTTYGKLLILLVGCMLTSALIVNPIIVASAIHQNPYPLVLKCIRVSGFNAFFTRSSAANIPINMELCKDLRLDEDFYSVSIPLGSTINMNGAAVTITVMTMAVCHTLGINVGLGSAILLCIMASVGACGSSGVAGGSLLLIPMACALFGISSDISMQAVAVGFIIGVVQDSLETALNSSGDAIFTATADIYERKTKKNV